MTLTLRRLLPGDESAFRIALERTQPTEPYFAFYWNDDVAFERYLHVLDDAERGIGIPEGHVASTLLFGFEGDEIVGRVSLRHELNAFLKEHGGHLGYIVVPEHRGRGVATELLRQGLAFARTIGLDRLLLTVDEPNAASRRVIEKCGGVFERLSRPTDLSEPKRLYWIDVTPRP